MPLSQKKNKINRSNIVTNSIKILKNGPHLDFLGGPVVKNLPANTGNMSSIPSGKIPHASEQVSPCATITEPAL